MQAQIAEVEFEIYNFDEGEEIVSAGTSANGVLKLKPLDRGLAFMLRRMYATAGSAAATGDTDLVRAIAIPATVSSTGVLCMRLSLAGPPLPAILSEKKRRKEKRRRR